MSKLSKICLELDRTIGSAVTILEDLFDSAEAADRRADDLTKLLNRAIDAATQLYYGHTYDDADEVAFAKAELDRIRKEMP